MNDLHHVFTFGPFELDEGHCELCREAHPVEIHATPLRLLLYLLQNRDRPVSKRELLDRVWSDSFVSENALTSALCEARHALGDDGASQRFIRTERGRGYRFVATVEERDAASSGSGATGVAVLPFTDMSPGRDQEYLADGLVEELIHALSQLEHLRVVARTSVFAFKGTQEDVRSIGARLEVGTVIEGSVRAEGDRVRITAQAIRVRDADHLWSARYDRKLENVLGLQEGIANEIVAALETRLKCEPRLAVTGVSPRIANRLRAGLSQVV